MPRRYVVKEKFWSLRSKFRIQTPDERVAYQVEGRLFSIGAKLSFQDPDGHELAFIEQKVLSFLPRYRILVGGKVVAELRKSFTFFKPHFRMRVRGEEYEIQGSLFHYDFEFRRRGRLAGRVSKAVWAWTDSYGVEVGNDEDDVVILCAVIVIDQCLHNDTGVDSDD